MKLSHLLAATALTLPVSAMAAHSYSYLDIGYRAAELSGEDGGGFDAEANFLLGDLFYVSMNINEVEFDDDVHLDRFGLGIGAHYNVYENIDLYGVVSYEDIEFDLPGPNNDFDDKGWGYEIGVRYILDEDWEFGLAGDFAQYEDDSVELESRHIVATAVYNFSDQYALIGEYSGGELIFDAPGLESEENSLHIGLRFQF